MGKIREANDLIQDIDSVIRMKTDEADYVQHMLKDVRDKLEEDKWYIISLETTVENFRKKEEETYTFEQAKKDRNRIHEYYNDCGKCPLGNYQSCELQDCDGKVLRQWAKDHPENKRITNGENFLLEHQGFHVALQTKVNVTLYDDLHHYIGVFDSGWWNSEYFERAVNE